MTENNVRHVMLIVVNAANMTFLEGVPFDCANYVRCEHAYRYSYFLTRSTTARHQTHD